MLEGSSDFVIHADSADVLLVLARTPGSRGGSGLSIVVTPAADPPGVTMTPHVMLDLTRPMSRVRLAGVAVPRDALLGAAGRRGRGHRARLCSARRSHWPPRRSAAPSACSR